MKKLFEFLATLFGGKKKKPPVVIVSPPVDKPIDIPLPPPSGLNWKDRRPIGMIMLASYDGIFKQDNQMNYVFDVSDFKTNLLRFADQCIEIMKGMNAQAMITWDLEGQQYAHPASYVGDPRFLPAQMELAADEYFKRFKDAGFKVGVCIRPDQIEYNADKTWLYHYSVSDHVENLAKKIQYCIDRWGIELFYVDSNVYGGRPGLDVARGGDTISYWVFKTLHEKFPHILLIPEWRDYDYFKYTAPWYTSAPKEQGGPPQTIMLSEEHKKLLPNSFLVAAVDRDCPEIEASVKQGNVMLFAAWWDDPNNKRIKQAYSNQNQ